MAITVPPEIIALPEIIEVKETLSGARKSFSCRVLSRATDRLVVLFISDRTWRVAELELPAGTVTFGYFWSDRAYNVYHWMTSAGATLAHYVNLADRTSLGEAQLTWRDLAVDLLLRPGYAPAVLDEDHLPPDLAPQMRVKIVTSTRDVLMTVSTLQAEVEAASTALWSHAFARERRSW